VTDNIFKQPNSWADRKLLELKARDQHPDKPYVFLTSCVASTAEDIDEMTEMAADCTFDEVAFNCNLEEFADVMGYDIELQLVEDQTVGYFRSFYKGVPCYYVDHSRIEYIWVNARSWKAERVLTALEKAGIEVNIPEE